jgi:hypothetical protein
VLPAGGRRRRRGRYRWRTKKKTDHQFTNKFIFYFGGILEERPIK